jgi:hypothetical protein
VLTLLRAAHDALPDDAPRPFFPDARLGLELVLVSPERPPSEAINYLGGVGDVLGAARAP